MNPSTSHPAFPAARAAVMFTGLVVCLGGMAVAVLVGLRHVAWIAPVIGAALACLAGTLISLVLVALAAKNTPQQIPMVMLSGMAVRLAVAIVGAAVLVLGFAMDRQVVVSATLVWYVVLLVAETRLFARYFKSFPSAGPLPAVPEEAPSC